MKVSTLIWHDCTVTEVLQLQVLTLSVCLSVMSVCLSVMTVSVPI